MSMRKLLCVRGWLHITDNLDEDGNLTKHTDIAEECQFEDDTRFELPRFPEPPKLVFTSVRDFCNMTQCEPDDVSICCFNWFTLYGKNESDVLKKAKLLIKNVLKERPEFHFPDGVMVLDYDNVELHNPETNDYVDVTEEVR